MRYVFIIVLTALFFIPGLREWHLSQVIGLRMATHHFLHGNIVHLAMNSLSVYYLYKRWSATEMGLAWGIASLSYLLSPVPAIGYSNIIFATAGLRTPALESSWWKHPATVMFLSMMLLMLFLPNVSSVTHIVSFVSGCLMASLGRFIKQVKKDGERYI